MKISIVCTIASSLVAPCGAMFLFRTSEVKRGFYRHNEADVFCKDKYCYGGFRTYTYDPSKDGGYYTNGNRNLADGDKVDYPENYVVKVFEGNYRAGQEFERECRNFGLLRADDCSAKSDYLLKDHLYGERTVRSSFWRDSNALIVDKWDVSFDEFIEGNEYQPAALASFLENALEGLKAMHKANLRHMGIGPNTLLLKGGKKKMVIAGFSTACVAGGRIDDAYYHLSFEQFIERAAYLAPEHLNEYGLVFGEAWSGADVWALGLTFMKALAGSEKFNAYMNWFKGEMTSLAPASGGRKRLSTLPGHETQIQKLLADFTQQGGLVDIIRGMLRLKPGGRLTVDGALGRVRALISGRYVWKATGVAALSDSTGKKMRETFEFSAETDVNQYRDFFLAGKSAIKIGDPVAECVIANEASFGSLKNRWFCEAVDLGQVLGVDLGPRSELEVWRSSGKWEACKVVDVKEGEWVKVEMTEQKGAAKAILWADLTRMLRNKK